ARGRAGGARPLPRAGGSLPPRPRRRGLHLAHPPAARRERPTGAMTLLNTPAGYGALTKLFHWLIVALFAFQYAAGNIMVRMEGGGIALGLSQDAFFNWHK